MVTNDKSLHWKDTQQYYLWPEPLKQFIWNCVKKINKLPEIDREHFFYYIVLAAWSSGVSVKLSSLRYLLFWHSAFGLKSHVTMSWDTVRYEFMVSKKLFWKARADEGSNLILTSQSSTVLYTNWQGNYESKHKESSSRTIIKQSLSRCNIISTVISTRLLPG